MQNTTTISPNKYYWIAGAIIFSMLFHFGIFIFLKEKNILNLRVFEEKIYANFEITTTSQRRMELERLYEEYDSPEEFSVLKESPEETLQDIPFAELEVQVPKTKTNYTKKLAISADDEIKNQLQNEMLKDMSNLTRNNSKLIKNVKEKPLKQDDLNRLKDSGKKKVAIKAPRLFTDLNSLSKMDIKGIDNGIATKKQQKEDVINIAPVPTNKLVPETIETEISKIDLKHEFDSKAPGDEIAVLPEKAYEDLSEELEVEFTTFSYPGKEDGYFEILITPGTGANLPLIPKDVLFVIDLSCSIADSEIESVQSVISNSLSLFNNDDGFNIVAFTAESKQLFSGFQAINADNINAANSFIDHVNITAENYLTDVYNVLTSIVRDIPGQKRPCNIFFVSDGKPTTGIKDIQYIVEDLALVRHPNVSIFPLDIGGNGNKYFLDLLAFESRGISWTGNDEMSEKEAIEEFILKYKDPILLNLEVNYCNLNEGEIYPKILPNLYKGQKIEIYGTCKINKEVALRVVGNTRRGKRELLITKTIPEQGNGGPEIAHEWAKRKVYYLVTRIAREGRSEELIMDIENLRKEYSINIPYKTIYGKYWFIKMV